MNIFKRFSFILLSVIMFLSSFFISAFGTEYYEDDEFVYLYDEIDNCYYVPAFENTFTNDESPSFYLFDTPHFPNFDVNKLPWSDAPSYITDIIYMSIDQAVSASKANDYTQYKMPFVCVGVTSSIARVVVGINVGLGRYGNGIYVSSVSGLDLYQYTTCYEAYFNSQTYEITSNWKKLSPAAVGNNGNIVRFTNNIVPSSASYDYYVYGGNGITLKSDVVLISYPTVSSGSTSSNSMRYTCNNILGFESNSFLYGPDDYSAYFGTFVPKTAEQQDADTKKGIWESIKALPGQIANAIKGFFEDLKNYLLYFQANKPEHVNPFNNILIDVQTFFDNQMADVSAFKDSLTSTLNNVVSYISTGSGIINSILTGVPILSAFVIFFVVFAIVRKVVGR